MLHAFLGALELIQDGAHVGGGVPEPDHGCGSGRKFRHQNGCCAYSTGADSYFFDSPVPVSSEISPFQA